MAKRIGVFVCHCGKNIGDTVDCAAVAEALRKVPGVVHSIDYRFVCSAPGQQLIAEAVAEHDLDGVVVGACSPHMHERTFRSTVEDAGLNPYMLEVANIREHCSWVHHDRDLATLKAVELVRMMVEKTLRNRPLERIRVPMTKRALVIGGGIAGIQAALDIAAADREVILLERSPSIGGHMSQLSETFPTLDCSQCILTPRMVEVAKHPRITLLTWSELEKLEGYIGNFTTTIRKRTRYVDAEKCTGCGLCQEKCPGRMPNPFEAGLGDLDGPWKSVGDVVRGAHTKAINVPFPQAVPSTPVLHPEYCLKFQKGTCGVCAKVCPTDAIDYEQQDELLEFEVGAVVVATGYDLYSIGRQPEDSPYEGYGEYGYGADPDIIDSLQFERLVSSSGPTNGILKRPSDDREPRTVAFLQCIGSRCPEKGLEYCSKICCMYTAKHTMLYKHAVHDGRAVVFYMDVRAGGKRYDEFHRRAVEQDDALYLRGRVSRIYRRDDKLILQGADTLSGERLEVPVDLVVTATAMLPQADSRELAQTLGVSYDRYGFYVEAHPKLRPVETNTAGIHLAGACQGPMDIPEAVAQGSAAAAKALALFAFDELEREPVVASINEVSCIGCWDCLNACPYEAITRKDLHDRRGELLSRVAEVNPGLCQGCGLCSAVCRSNSAQLAGFNDLQLHAELQAL
ncbi:MAG: 4Fe-4S dicluster domain-containing protein [Candidatus Coatesbacteria bacterium]|nr:4Fe-4S dicluster domain-containing protein [Candidatus Coatesbacteria bacterium]